MSQLFIPAFGNRKFICRSNDPRRGGERKGAKAEYQRKDPNIVFILSCFLPVQVPASSSLIIVSILSCSSSCFLFSYDCIHEEVLTSQSVSPKN